MNKPKLYICNAFSLSMLDREEQKEYPRIPQAMSLEEVQSIITGLCFSYGVHELVSAIGHGDTAVLISKQLGRIIPADRITVKLQPGDYILVAQYVGPRLPEGVTKLPPGATIEWWAV